jgi:hypothetical protein
MISATVVPDSACLSANAICSSVECLLPIENPPFLATGKAKALTSRMDQETGRTSLCTVTTDQARSTSDRTLASRG